MSTKIYISGCYSGPSPSAGLGMARSMRAAFPEAIIVGVDYWSGSSGLSHEVFDEVWLQPSWDHINHELHAARILEILEAGCFWISALDIEVSWLAKKLGSHPRLLIPNEAGIDASAKIGGNVADLLPFSVPETVTTDVDDFALHAFCRKHSWRIWLKGPYHDAVAIHSWRQFEAVRGHLSAHWKSQKLLVQAHVKGHEESICLSAWQGELVSAIHMEKRLTTPEGKTWAGRVKPLPQSVQTQIAQVVKELNWNGGAEIELLLDADGKRWFMEWNPRYPAWIHGATLGGYNLVGDLLAKAMGVSLPKPLLKSKMTEFTRVVLEIPVRPELSLPPRMEHAPDQMMVVGKYGAALSTLSQQMIPDIENIEVENLSHSKAVTGLSKSHQVDRSILEDLGAISWADEQTPARHFLPMTAQLGFRHLATNVARVDLVRVQPALSLKTSPDERYLLLAKQLGDFRQETKWLTQLPSQLNHCGECCERAKRWLIAMGRSFDSIEMDHQRRQGPKWLSQKFQWGPNPWPLSWCESVMRKTIDCGVFAAFACEIFRAKGLAAFPGQIVQQFDRASTEHWRKTWSTERNAFGWIGEKLVYHEVVIIRTGAETADIYDPTEGAWLNPEDLGPGAVVAVRSEAPGALYWGLRNSGKILMNDQWSEMK